MKADHDLDTAVTEGSLDVIRERYNIPTEYGLHVPRSGQRPYSSDASGVCISVDALEAGPCALARLRSSRRRGGGAQLNGGRFQVWLGREEAGSLELGSAANSCKKVGSGGVPDVTSPTATRCSYLRSLLSPLLTIPSYFVVASVVLTARRASCFLQLGRVDLAHLTRVRSVVRLLTLSYLCQVGSTVLGRPRWRSSCPRA
ncbi:hypothetical protein B296_00000250 [Ensete ventricosum]|uniref:Uncharacterized protein n=1 Tax=Ensete ventricosum TaxID=4639 RepID=A0A427B3A0_ENSVE|nr:hypothetical protein B296_00000250 [Ensete ventricosum]